MSLIEWHLLCIILRKVKPAFLICLWALFFVQPLPAAFDRAAFDIASFKAAAKSALRPYGHFPVDIVFQDAATDTEQEVIHDGAMVFALGRATNIANMFGKYRLAYRLILATGQTDVIFMRYTAEGNRSIVLPKSMTVIFDADISRADFDAVVIRIGKLVGHRAELTPSSTLKRVVVDLGEPDISSFMQLYDLVIQSPEIGVSRKLGYSYEKYAMPFAHGNPVVLTHEIEIDLDQLRDVVPKLLAEGKKMTTDRSLLPRSLQASRRRTLQCFKVFLSN